MSFNGANSCDPDTENGAVFKSGNDGLVSLVCSTNMESMAVLQNDETSLTETVVNQTSFDVPHCSIAEAVGCDTDLTTVSVNPLPLQMSWSQLEKRNVLVCELIHSGSRFLIY